MEGKKRRCSSRVDCVEKGLERYVEVGKEKGRFPSWGVACNLTFWGGIAANAFKDKMLKSRKGGENQFRGELVMLGYCSRRGGGSGPSTATPI